VLIGHVDATHHVVGFPDHPHFALRLDEIERLRRRQQLLGNAARIARRLGGERKPASAGQHLVVRRLHLPRRPRLEHGVVGIADVRRHLAGAVPVAVEGMGGVLPDRAVAQSRRRLQPFDAQGEPGELRRRQSGNCVVGRSLLLRRRLRGRGTAGRQDRNAGDECRHCASAQQGRGPVAVDLGSGCEFRHLEGT
jgi:hypothetical protein